MMASGRVKLKDLYGSQVVSVLIRHRKILNGRIESGKEIRVEYAGSTFRLRTVSKQGIGLSSYLGDGIFNAEINVALGPICEVELVKVESKG